MRETVSGNKDLVKKHIKRRDLGVDGIIFRMNLKGRVCVDVEWIQIAQNGIHKRGFLNTVINFRVP
jgi:hypothetical protein